MTGQSGKDVRLVLAVATTREALPRLHARLASLDVLSCVVLEPGRERRVLLVTLVDEHHAEAAAVDLRTDGWMAVTRPAGGAALTAWTRDTQPVTIGGRVSLCLAWAEHDRANLPGIVELGPGGFGSGHHPTTRTILEVLAERIEGGERLLDVGCGSGVLALAALELGAAHAVGVDMKPEAVEAARRNAALNDRDDRFVATVDPPGSVGGPFDVVVANIARAGVVALAPRLVGAVAAGGWLAVSGISPSQADSVAEFLRPLAETERRVEGDWATLVLSRPDAPSPS